jgi:hypothetical protein
MNAEDEDVTTAELAVVTRSATRFTKMPAPADVSVMVTVSESPVVALLTVTVNGTLLQVVRLLSDSFRKIASAVLYDVTFCVPAALVNLTVPARVVKKLAVPVKSVPPKV